MARFTPPAADAMRARILEAARDEFAALGLTGGRVERLAAAADSNKAQVFHYFGGKEGLFDALLVQELGGLHDAVPLDTDDLPAWAGRLHDALVERPWVARLATWQRLERADAVVPALVERHEAAVAEVERAQRAGVLPRSFRPAVLFALVLQLAGVWATLPPEATGTVSAVVAARRRQVVVDAVAQLLGR